MFRSEAADSLSSQLSSKVTTALLLLFPCICARNPYGRGTEGYSLFGGSGSYGGGYPMFPSLPWVTVSQRLAGRPLYLPNPPLYISGISNDQVGAYTNYRWDFFFEHGTATTAAPATPAGNGTAAPASGEPKQSEEVLAQNNGVPTSGCRATNIKNSAGNNSGFCLAETVAGRNCPSGLADDGVGCGQSQKCCVNEAPSPEIQHFLDSLKAGKTR